jgi:hypothetical protein
LKTFWPGEKPLIVAPRSRSSMGSLETGLT